MLSASESPNKFCSFSFYPHFIIFFSKYPFKLFLLSFTKYLQIIKFLYTVSGRKICNLNHQTQVFPHMYCDYRIEQSERSQREQVAMGDVEDIEKSNSNQSQTPLYFIYQNKASVLPLALLVIDDVLLILQIFNSTNCIFLGLLTPLRGFLLTRSDKTYHLSSHLYII